MADPKKNRKESHWCIEGNCFKCRGIVAEKNSKHSSLEESNLYQELNSGWAPDRKCECYCHY